MIIIWSNGLFYLSNIICTFNWSGFIWMARNPSCLLSTFSSPLFVFLPPFSSNQGYTLCLEWNISNSEWNISNFFKKLWLSQENDLKKPQIWKHPFFQNFFTFKDELYNVLRLLNLELYIVYIDKESSDGFIEFFELDCFHIDVSWPS